MSVEFHGWKSVIVGLIVLYFVSLGGIASFAAAMWTYNYLTGVI